MAFSQVKVLKSALMGASTADELMISQWFVSNDNVAIMIFADFAMLCLCVLIHAVTAFKQAPYETQAGHMPPAET